MVPQKYCVTVSAYYATVFTLVTFLPKINFDYGKVIMANVIYFRVMSLEKHLSFMGFKVV